MNEYIHKDLFVRSSMNEYRVYFEILIQMN
jgi:hypothetical protein